MKLKQYLNEAKRLILKAPIKKKINKELINLTTPKGKTFYFRQIPLQDIWAILEKYGIVVLQEDGTKWDGFLTGRSAQVYFDIAPIDSEIEGYSKYRIHVPYTNANLALSWYKMSSGNYEINTYVT